MSGKRGESILTANSFLRRWAKKRKALADIFLARAFLPGVLGARKVEGESDVVKKAGKFKHVKGAKVTLESRDFS